jgi:hypothetical protein
MRIIDTYEWNRRAKRKGGKDFDPEGILLFNQAVEKCHTLLV